MSIISPAFLDAVSIDAIRAPVLRGGRFQQGTINLNFNVPWKETIENLWGDCLENIVGLRRRFFQIDPTQGQQFFYNDSLLNDRFEFVVDHINRIHFRLGIGVHNRFGNVPAVP
jgi:hypothetical protein